MNYENDYEMNRVNSDSESETDETVTLELASNPDSDTSARRLTRAQHAKLMKLSDPGYHTAIRRANNKNIMVEMYSTRCNPGAPIRDPRFGTLSKDRVGTLAERSYFKVRMTSVGDGCEPVTLFYDSPEGYEKHHRTRLPFDLKQSWRSRFVTSS
jgi:hypothetical protein